MIYLACGERGNEGITRRPKDESEFLAKKKTFQANIFKFFIKGEPISKFWGAANQTRSLTNLQPRSFNSFALTKTLRNI